jgi:hypothetical protein
MSVSVCNFDMIITADDGGAVYAVGMIIFRIGLSDCVFGLADNSDGATFTVTVFSSRTLQPSGNERRE